MLVGLRIALGIAWLVVVAAEMIAVDSGLGYLVIDARNSGKRYDLVVAAMLMIGLIGLALDFVFRRLEKHPRRFAGGSAMSLTRRAMLGMRSAGSVSITGLHGYLNVNWAAILNDYLPPNQAQVQRRVHPGDLPPRLPGDRLHLRSFRLPARSSCRRCSRASRRSRKR